MQEALCFGSKTETENKLLEQEVKVLKNYLRIPSDWDLYKVTEVEMLEIVNNKNEKNMEKVRDIANILTTERSSAKWKCLKYRKEKYTKKKKV